MVDDVAEGVISLTVLCLHRLMYANSQEEYVRARDTFIKKLEKRGRKVFLNYFKANWENCKEKWVKYHRMDCLHIGNNTNNRIESAWGKLKLQLRKKTPIDEAFGEILVTQIMREEEWEVQMLKGELVLNYHYDYDKEMNMVFNCVTPFATSLIAEQYYFAIQVSPMW